MILAGMGSNIDYGTPEDGADGASAAPPPAAKPKPKPKAKKPKPAPKV